MLTIVDEMANTWYQKTGLTGSGQLGGPHRESNPPRLCPRYGSCPSLRLCANNRGKNLTNSHKRLATLEYDRPYHGQMFVFRGNVEQMAAACPKTINLITLGCSIRLQEGRGCIVFIASDAILAKTDWNYDIIYRHERGHCLGWSGEHKGARPATPENMVEQPLLSDEAIAQLRAEYERELHRIEQELEKTRF